MCPVWPCLLQSQVRQAAARTNDTAGDGTTTATIMSAAFIAEGLKIVAAGGGEGRGVGRVWDIWGRGCPRGGGGGQQVGAMWGGVLGESFAGVWETRREGGCPGGPGWNGGGWVWQQVGVGRRSLLEDGTWGGGRGCPGEGGGGRVVGGCGSGWGQGAWSMHPYSVTWDDKSTMHS